MRYLPHRLLHIGEGPGTDPLYIRNEPPSYYFRQPGHCTRCKVALDADAYIVREEVCWSILGDWAMTQKEWVPVCEPCAGPAAVDNANRSHVCGGCGLRMRAPGVWGGRVCSARCEQRLRRARRKAMSSRFCLGCNMLFRGRADARFCSPACRQRAYRERAASIASDRQTGNPGSPP